ncbi:hypothetical protein WL29_23310 [Burkholderia ubonensis]|uniref:Uncharacterized protein n=1 Tax=Burkholderia ubonensis TaxID=101571 RepID=A0A106QDJ1_9BURK|nr:hypothetical protein [Burkholderia ubonensis]KWA84288.1 hypothetical protein WL29_23310 [Burkholderia ubonensis]
MARVTAYEATDGSLHRDRKDWLRHESNLIVAKNLQSIIDGKVADQAKSAELHDFIVNGIGLNALRDLFAIQFKPGADDGDAAGAGTPAAGAEGGAPAAEGGAPSAPAAADI